MTPHDLVHKTLAGRKYGPIALGIMYVTSVAGGVWVGTDGEMAKLVGCTALQLKSARDGLVRCNALSYSSPRQGGPRTYEVRLVSAVRLTGLTTGSAVVGGVVPAGGSPAQAEVEAADGTPAPAPAVAGGRGPSSGVPSRATEDPSVLGAGAAGGMEAPPSAPVPAKNGKPHRTQQPADPLFDQIVAFAYGGVRPSKCGPVATIAREMVLAGLTDTRLRRELPRVVQEYAPYRTSLDIGTIESCWRWILSPPVKVGRPTATDLAVEALANGNPWETPPTQHEG